MSAGDRSLPTRVTGTLAGGAREGLRDLAVAVNGRMDAAGRTFRLRGRTCEYFSLLVPEEALRPGATALEMFEVEGRRAPAGSLGGA